jgi:hypothetical protein
LRILRARNCTCSTKGHYGRRRGKTSKAKHEIDALLQAILGVGGHPVYPICASSKVYPSISFLGYYYRPEMA